MIDTTNWTYFFKINPETREQCCNNMLYTPLVNQTGTILCMHWDPDSEYQQLDTTHVLSDKLMNFFFERELKYLTIFKEFDWCPTLLEVDYVSKKIFIEWNSETCNDIIYTSGRDITTEYPDWQDQLFNIIKDVIDFGYYKTALYPHCFFFDKKGILKTIDFYGCIEQKNPFIQLSLLDGMLGTESSHRFVEATVDGVVNVEVFFKRALSTHVKWPDDPFPKFYDKLFLDVDWDEIIAHITTQDGVQITTDPARWKQDTPGYNEIYKLWGSAKFNPAAIKWTNYYPIIHFSETVIHRLAAHLGVKIHRAWISRIDPGYFAPWHWDVDDNESDYQKKGDILRYSCFIEPANMGHLIIIDDKYYYNMPQGAIIKWVSHNDWHCGINGGLTTKFMLHLLAYA